VNNNNLTNSRLIPRSRLRTPQGLLFASFAALIFIGTLVLWMPASHLPGKVGFWDALFTATSAVCVTGLVVVDTGSTFTLFGQAVILFLIQAGGLGVMTFAALLFQLLGRRISLQSQAALQDTFLQKDAAHQFKSTLWRIIRMTAAIEAVGAFLLFCFLLPKMLFFDALFFSLFHSISAFCNAGFSLFSDSLVGIRGNFGFMLVMIFLIILGGLGHTVLIESWQRLVSNLRKSGKTRTRLSVHSQIVFRMTFILLGIGFFGLLIFGMTPQENGFSTKFSAAFFQSVTVRTAGFNSIDFGNLPTASLFLLVMLMFIGGSPGSCAGGIKTTTIAIWFARIRSMARHSDEVTLMGRSISGELTQKVMMLFGLSLLYNSFGILFLLHTQSNIPGIGMHDLFFEQVSAFATVGISTGITAKLTLTGRLWIILTMYIGRLGPLTFAAWAIGSAGKSKVRHPEGKVMIG
jgi:trk system potassium uptake protein TrkH